MCCRFVACLDRHVSETTRPQSARQNPKKMRAKGVGRRQAVLVKGSVDDSENSTGAPKITRACSYAVPQSLTEFVGGHAFGHQHQLQFPKRQQHCGHSAAPGTACRPSFTHANCPWGAGLYSPGSPGNLAGNLRRLWRCPSGSGTPSDGHLG